MPTDIGDLLERTRSEHGEMLSVHDPAVSVAQFDQVAETAAYHAVPAAVRATWQAVVDRYGKTGFEAFQHAMLLSLIERFEQRRISRGYSDTVLQCFEKTFERIVHSIEDPAFELYRTDTDILLKDLALCRLKMFPAGAQVIEPSSSFHRSMMFRGGISQAARMARLLVASGGNDRWYQIHTHLQELTDFNPDGWNACYVRLADMMLLHPEIRGMWGGSWFYDPALEELSPRLSYLRSVPQANGAGVFFSNVELHGGALSKSETRKAAYERGDYIPRAYALIWPRKAMIAWAETMRGTIAANASDSR